MNGKPGTAVQGPRAELWRVAKSLTLVPYSRELTHEEGDYRHRLVIRLEELLHEIEEAELDALCEEAGE